MIRFGLCCVFNTVPIKFRHATATRMLAHSRPERLRRLAEICLHNAQALEQALRYCKAHGIGAFRINSQILPLKTHPLAGYALESLPGGNDIEKMFRRCGRLSRRLDIRTSFHPDQFIVLNSPDPQVVERSVAELLYQAQVARWVNADVINLHGGGAYGDKASALQRLVETIGLLPVEVKKRLTLENDDRVFTPRDLLPVCRQVGIPLVYDVHHHRCLPDAMSVRAATRAALATWPREPLFHLSSPQSGWHEDRPCGPHHDYIHPDDFPREWRKLTLTVEVEAKAKEMAVFRLIEDLGMGAVRNQSAG
jgi:UV DNA damage endonuclease